MLAPTPSRGRWLPHAVLGFVGLLVVLAFRLVMDVSDAKDGFGPLAGPAAQRERQDALRDLRVAEANRGDREAGLPDIRGRTVGGGNDGTNARPTTVQEELRRQEDLRQSRDSARGERDRRSAEQARVDKAARDAAFREATKELSGLRDALIRGTAMSEETRRFWELAEGPPDSRLPDDPACFQAWESLTSVATDLKKLVTAAPEDIGRRMSLARAHLLSALRAEQAWNEDAERAHQRESAPPAESSPPCQSCGRVGYSQAQGAVEPICKPCGYEAIALRQYDHVLKILERVADSRTALTTSPGWEKTVGTLEALKKRRDAAGARVLATDSDNPPNDAAPAGR